MGRPVKKVEDRLEEEFFRIVSESAGRFTAEVERLGRRYRRLYGAVGDLKKLKREVENRLVESVGGGFSPARPVKKKGRSKRREAEDSGIPNALFIQNRRSVLNDSPVKPGQKIPFSAILPWYKRTDPNARLR